MFFDAPLALVILFWGMYSGGRGLTYLRDHRRIRFATLLRATVVGSGLCARPRYPICPQDTYTEASP